MAETAEINFRKVKVALQNVAYYHADYNSIITKGGHRARFGVIGA